MRNDNYGAIVTVRLNSVDKVREFVIKANKFDSEVDGIRGRYICDAKSILSILAFDLNQSLDVGIISDDKEEIEKFKEEMKELECSD